jgi:PKD repeat protein
VRRQRPSLLFAVLALVALIPAGGCTLGPRDGRGPTAVIGASTLRGPAPLAATFDATPSHAETAIVDCEWSFQDGTPPVDGTRCTHVFRIPGISVVRLTVRDTEGRADEAQVEVVVDLPLPVASFSLSVDAPQVGQWVTADGSSSCDPHGTPLEFAWDFGDGTVAVGAVTGHAYTSAGRYTITLVVRDAHGVQSSVCRNLIVQEPLPGGCGGTLPILLGE